MNHHLAGIERRETKFVSGPDAESMGVGERIRRDYSQEKTPDLGNPALCCVMKAQCFYPLPAGSEQRANKHVASGRMPRCQPLVLHYDWASILGIRRAPVWKFLEGAFADPTNPVFSCKRVEIYWEALNADPACVQLTSSERKTGSQDCNLQKRANIKREFQGVGGVLPCKRTPPCPYEEIGTRKGGRMRNFDLAVLGKRFVKWIPSGSCRRKRKEVFLYGFRK